MSKQKINITIDDGNSVSINLYALTSFTITGTETLTTDWAITGTGTPQERMELDFTYNATVTLGGHHIYVMGIQMPDVYASKIVYITTTYIAAAWIVNFTPALQQTNIIDTDNIIDEAVTLAKVEDVASSYLIVGNASNRPTAVHITGAISISNTGVSDITSGSVIGSMVSATADIPLVSLLGATGAKVMVTNVTTHRGEESTATTTDLAKIAGITNGTTAASKAVVLGADGKVDALDITALTINGTLITPTPAEINILSGVTSNATELNKLDACTTSTAELNILTGVTANAADINLLTGAAFTAADLALLAGTAAAGVTAADAIAIKDLDTVVTFDGTAGFTLKSGMSLNTAAGISVKSRLVTTSDTIAITDHILLLSVPSGADMTLTLPTLAAGANLEFTIIIVGKNAGTKDVIFAAAGAETITRSDTAANTKTITSPVINSVYRLINCSSQSKWYLGGV